MTDLSHVPLTAISSKTKHLISTLLNPLMYITDTDSPLRDWRGLAQICSISTETVLNIASDPDPSGCILSITQKKSKDFTLQNLIEALEQIQRWDIVDDSQPLLEKDAELYLETLEKSKNAAEQNDFDIDADILTIHDQMRIEQGKDTQHYDAFLLYAEEDSTFAEEVSEKLESQNNLKLCLKERDLIAGITFEHEAVMRLILERCNRLILIVTSHFLKSSANKFFLNFAQAASIDRNQARKIIPCIYENVQLPPQLSFLSKIYYQPNPENFWKKLVLSTKPVESKISKGHNSQIKKSTSLDSKIEPCIKNGLIKKISEEEKVKCDEPIKGTTSKKLPFFSFKKKDNSDTKNSVQNDVESARSESIPNLPSLGDLDSLSSLTSVSESKKKSKKQEKFLKNCRKKLQAFLDKA